MLTAPLTNLTALRRGAAALAGAATAALLAASPAAADSVAYVKAGDIWLSTTDGQRQYRDGRVIADIATPVSNTDPTMSFRGPFEPEVSPNGKRVSYTYYWQYTGYDPYCTPTTNCYVKRLYHGTAFTDRTGWTNARRPARPVL
jgi:hypothetical protein